MQDRVKGVAEAQHDGGGLHRGPDRLGPRVQAVCGDGGLRVNQVNLLSQQVRLVCFSLHFGQ